MAHPVRKAVFPVGGLGTRFLPATKAMPKEMLTVVDKPLIQYAVEEAAASGITEFIFVTGRGKSAIEDHFDYSVELNVLLEKKGLSQEQLQAHQKRLAPGSIVYTRQQEPLGLGHAVWCARHVINNEPFAVILADELMFGSTPCLKGMIDLHQHYNNSNIIVIDQVPLEYTSRYGIVDPEQRPARGQSTAIRAIVEKPSPGAAPSDLAIVGRYILNPEILDLLAQQAPGSNSEIQLTDSIQALSQHQSLRGYFYDGHRFDCGSKAGYVAATLHVAMQRQDLEAELGDYLMKMGFSSKSLKFISN